MSLIIYSDFSYFCRYRPHCSWLRNFLTVNPITVMRMLMTVEKLILYRVKLTYYYSVSFIFERFPSPFLPKPSMIVRNCPRTFCPKSFKYFHSNVLMYLIDRINVRISFRSEYFIRVF